MEVLCGEYFFLMFLTLRGVFDGEGATVREILTGIRFDDVLRLKTYSPYNLDLISE